MKRTFDYGHTTLRFLFGSNGVKVLDKRFNFTKAIIAFLPPAVQGRYNSYYDTGVLGLMLMVTGNGVKTFYVYKKVQGQPERIKIGLFPNLSIEQARNRAKVLLSDIALDKNPAQDRRKIRAEITLEELFNLFGEKQGKLKKTWKNDCSLYKNYLSPWGHKRISDIRRSDVKDLHSDIGRKESHPYQANRMRALLHTMYEFAIERGYEGVNPCRGIKKYTEQKRDRYLRKEELPVFFNVVMNDPHPIIRDFIPFMLVYRCTKR